jgi:subtilisin family serine protease
MRFIKSALRLSAALAALHLGLHAAAAQPRRAAAAQKSAGAKQSYVAGELLVQFADAKALVGARALNAQLGATVLGEFAFAPWQHVRLPPGLSVKAALARYGQMPGVRYAQPNFTYALADTAPNDPRYLSGELYGLAKIQAPPAWDTTRGSAAVVAAVVDTGVRYTHEDLSANMWRNPGETPANGLDDDGNGYIDDVFGIDTANNDADPLDDHGHGTHVAGIVGAVGNNGLGVAGVNWNVRLMALKMFDAAGNGTSATAIAALQYVVMMKRRGVNVRVTNNSWGGAPEAPAYDLALRAAFDAAGQADILNACAAGNANADTDSSAFYPANYDVASIISVAASDAGDNRAGFSNYGATMIDLAAPGVSILSTVNGGDTTYGFLSGTSMSSPMVAGAAALLAAHNGSLSALSLKATLMNTVDVLPQWSGLVLTNGRLNLARALQTQTACAYDATPASAAFTETASASSVNVAAAPGCNWIATSNASWLTVTAGAQGYGSGTVNYAVAANAGAARTGTLVVADQIITVTQAAGVPAPPVAPPAPGQVLIGEFRIDGPGGPDDEFVELYNNTDQPITVATADGSEGWALVSKTTAGGALAALYVLPAGTTIPARGHFLYATARGYSLQTYGGAAAADATGPAIYAQAPAAPFAGLALFRTSNPLNWTAANRLDAVGGTQGSALLREGAGLQQNFDFAADAQYSFVRKLTTGLPQDTDDNAQDFALVATKANNFGGLQAQLGSPGPENSASPVQRNAQIKATLIDPGVSSASAPNRVRDLTPVLNGAQGTLTIRRKFKNSTPAPVTRLRFRIVDITTAPATPATADLRARDAFDANVTTSVGAVLVKGTTLEQPPAQVLGGGLNSTLTVALPGGALAPGATVNVQFVLGVQQGGTFRFLVNVEALP